MIYAFFLYKDQGTTYTHYKGAFKSIKAAEAASVSSDERDAYEDKFRFATTKGICRRIRSLLSFGTESKSIRMIFIKPLKKRIDGVYKSVEVQFQIVTHLDNGGQMVENMRPMVITQKLIGTTLNSL